MDLRPFEKKVWLSSPTMHGEELKYITEAYENETGLSNGRRKL